MSRKESILNYSNTVGSAKLAAVNTVIIYFQRLFAAVLALITTPIILNQLGVEDFGLYSLTMGLVGMLAFLNWSLSSATQRYIAFTLGEKDSLKLKKIFASALAIHLFYASILLILISSIGVIFIDSLLSIPANRVADARYILFILGFISFFGIISVPFYGVMRAHENFIIIALLGIIESILKFGIAILIIFSKSDKLILYSILLLAVSAIVMVLNILLSKRNYKEINLKKKYFSFELIKEMLSFMGWNILGSLAILSRNQGVSVLLNIFFGVVKNAAYGIAMQVNSALGILSQGIIGALSPQLIKSAGKNDHKKMLYLMRTMSKMAVLTVSIAAIPLFFEAPQILSIWLKQVPPDTVIFVRLIIVYGLIMLLSAGIQTTFSAIGKVKLYNIWVSTILILNLPISYVLFKLGYASYSIIIVGMALEFISLIARLILLRKYIHFSINQFVIDLSLKITTPIFAFSALLILIGRLITEANLKLVFTILLTFTIYLPLLYYLALDTKQKKLVKELVSSIKGKISLSKRQ